MKLRKKLIVFSVLYIFIWISIMIVLMDKTIIKGYQTIERNRFEWQVERAYNGINDLIKTQEVIVKDWAKWDEAYRLVNREETLFIDENITEALFQDLGIDYVVFFDYKDELLYTKGYNHQSGEYIEVPDEFLQEIVNYENQSGLLYIGDKPLVFSAFKVTDSEGLKEPLGLFVFSFYLTEEHFEELSESLKEEIAISAAAVDYDSDSSDRFIRSIGDYSVGECYIPYLNIQKAIKIDILLSHEITKLGRSMIKDSLGIFILSFIILNSIVYLGVKHSVLRIQKISSDVSQISHSRDLKRRLDIKGDDELGMLRDDINFMLNKIEKMNNQLTEYATFDIMTGVLNRRIGFEKLSKLIEASNKNQFDLTICFIDINDLKIVNDEYGHNAGDQLIIDVSEIIEKATRTTDIFCRLGGDEFLIIFPYCDEQNARDTTDRIQHDIDEFNSSGVRKYRISISKGVVEYDGKMSVTEYVEYADSKMYEDKKRIKASMTPS